MLHGEVLATCASLEHGIRHTLFNSLGNGLDIIIWIQNYVHATIVACIDACKTCIGTNVTPVRQCGATMGELQLGRM